jgi:hypothetical protein
MTNTYAGGRVNVTAKGARTSWRHKAADMCGLTKSGVQSFFSNQSKHHPPKSPVCFWIWYQHFKQGKAARFLVGCRRNTPEQNEAARLRRNARSRLAQAQARARGYKRSRETVRAWDRKRRATDPKYRLKQCLKARIHKMLKQFSVTKKNKTVELIGCSKEFFMEHLEKRFKNGMAWNNHGKIWHIDHIYPLSRFDLTDPEQQKRAFHYSNCQPLYVTENIVKGDKIIPHQAQLI